MRNISDTIARLAASRALQSSKAPHAFPSRLTALESFGTNPGGLKAHLHIPADLPVGAPLVVVLHGCTQTAGAYDVHSGWSTLADRAKFAVLYPEQQRANNPNLCFNWFVPEDVRRDAGEAHSIRQMIDRVVKTHGVDPQRIFVTGLSAGGAMAAAMLASYPEVFAGGAIIAGLPYGSATTVPQAFDRMRDQGSPSDRDLQALLRGASSHAGPWPRIAIWQGSADRTVVPSNAPRVAAQWREAHRVADLPQETKVSGQHTRQRWVDPSGVTVIELNTISGMGHGTPIGSGLGTPGPYMLDVGVSSTAEIAGFWGMAKGTDLADLPKAHVAAAVATPGGSPKAERLSKTAPPSGPAPASSKTDVNAIIENALRAAGLMR